MTVTYTFDVLCTLDGYGSYRDGADWGGYWGKQGAEFLDRRRAVYGTDHRLVLGANTFRMFAQILGGSTEEPDESDPNTLMRNMPTTVVSTTLEGPLDWPGGATVVSGDAVDVVARLKEESDVPLRSHGSLSMNRALMAAGLVDLCRSRSSRSSAVSPGRIRSSRVRPTSTSSWSRAERSTTTPSSSSIGRPGTAEARLRPRRRPAAGS